MKFELPIKVVCRGKLTTGPKPGTPEFEQEQAARAATQAQPPGAAEPPEEPHGNAQHRGKKRGD